MSSGETWLLNETLTESNVDFTSLNFTSNSQPFVRILRQYNNTPIPPVNSLLYYKSDGTYAVAVYTNDDGIAFWNKQAFRTITFDTAPTGDLLTWLQANGVKQSSKLSVDLTTLSGWSNLSSGSHTIKIVAKGTGYRDSEKSAGVSVTKAAEVYTDCLTFTGEDSEFTLAVGSGGAKEWDGTVWYSTDHNTWNVWDGTAVSSANKKLYLRGKGNTKFYTSKGARLSLSAKAGCSGNIQTLLDWENPPTNLSTEYCYGYMFKECTNLTSTPELPAKILGYRCYLAMFANCTSITSSPNLPATTLTDGCYSMMFECCTNLISAPELPAGFLAANCYSYMFADCTKLKVNTTSGTKIFTCPSTIPQNAVNYMFRDTGGSFTGTPNAGNTYYWTE